MNDLTGQYLSIIPFPGKINSKDFQLGSNWYSDKTEKELFIDAQQGAKTVTKFRKEFLMDWAERWEWLQSN